MVANRKSKESRIVSLCNLIGPSNLNFLPEIKMEWKGGMRGGGGGANFPKRLDYYD